ncbi:hypothetical protein [Endozoicomonas lisbonensis]|uniref:Uncharacterized protein n=1 Tax=Endozoicomonas lisbonensis TaxID=3120522 RepID=A0ABV2SHJ4_9GAMM
MPNNISHEELLSNYMGYVIQNPFQDRLTSNLFLSSEPGSDMGYIELFPNNTPIPVPVENIQLGERMFFPESVTYIFQRRSYHSEVIRVITPSSPSEGDTFVPSPYSGPPLQLHSPFAFVKAPTTPHTPLVNEAPSVRESCFCALIKHIKGNQ